MDVRAEQRAEQKRRDEHARCSEADALHADPSDQVAQKDHRKHNEQLVGDPGNYDCSAK